MFQAPPLPHESCISVYSPRLKSELSSKNNNNLIMLTTDPEMQLYIRYSKKARNYEHYHGILQKVESTIDYRPYGIDKLLGDRALALFRNLKEKYRKRELMLNIDGWYQTEKKVFVWFVAMHTYYLEREGIKLGSIGEFRAAMDFEAMARLFFGKSVFFIEFQLLNLVKITEKMQWSEEEDGFIINAVEKCGSGRWADVSREIFQASNGVKFINAKNCRERWQNHLDDTKIKGNWTMQEDLTIVEAVLERYGKKWSKMKGELNFRRTEHMIKNRYNSLMTKNKRFRHQKQKQVSQRLLNELRSQVYGNRSINHDQEITERKQVQQPQQLQKSVQQESYLLKQQNLSPDQSEQEKAQPHANNESAYDNFQQPQQSISKMQKQPIIKSQIKQSPEPLEQEQIYPFQNYSYELQMCNYQQMHEMQMNQLLYYQQYMNFPPLPTAETYQNTLEIHHHLKEQQRERAQNDEES